MIGRRLAPDGAGATRDRPGMTLIEVLVVAAIVSMLAGLPLVAVRHSRQSANRVACSINMG